MIFKFQTHFTEQLGNSTQSGNEIWSVYVMLQKKIFHKKIV